MAAITIGLHVVVARATDSYPNRPVEVIVPFPPGGIVDLVARTLAAKLSSTLGQNFFVENHGGASGAVGAVMTARAQPDGYTLLITTSAITLAALLNKTDYDPANSFAPIGVVSVSPVALLVSPGSKAKTVSELIVQIKKDGNAQYASAGLGTIDNLAAQMFRLSTGVEMTHIPFTGAGPALVALAGGQVPIAFQALPGVVPLMRANAVRVLAVTSRTRSSAAPDIPTFAELGVHDVVVETATFVLAPRNTRQNVVDKLNRAITEILQTPDVREHFINMGLKPVSSSPAEAAARLNDELEKWDAVVKRAGLKEGTGRRLPQ